MKSFFCRSRPLAWKPPDTLAFAGAMTLQGQYDEAMLDFNRGDFDGPIAKLKAVLAADPAHFDAQLSRPKPPPIKFPSQPWKKKKVEG
jgi:hypothetical protein